MSDAWSYALTAFASREELPAAFLETARTPFALLADRLAARRANGVPLVVGLCGAQGSGKSTLAEVLALRWRLQGLRCAVLSLDDLYLPKEARERLAVEVHPLFRLRGPPGTHDVALGLEVIEALRRADAASGVALPRFDKASDTRRPPDLWDLQEEAVDIILLEGWCVGARPQAHEALEAPVNALEAAEDPEGRWRLYANDCLAGPYQRLFAELDVLVLLAAPGFDAVLAWRLVQEHKLRARLAREGRAGGMSDAEVTRFVGVYERLTRHILVEMPARADVMLRLDRQHRIVSDERR